ncbi:hypothetical protein EPUL_005845, partial [Erysiphe pulchra]
HISTCKLRVRINDVEDSEVERDRIRRAEKSNERESRERDALWEARKAKAKMCSEVNTGTHDINRDYKNLINVAPSARNVNRKGDSKLRTIVGREGKSPLDYKKFLDKTMVTMSMMKLYQASPDFVKCSRKYSTRINEKRVKRGKIPAPVVEEVEEILLVEVTSSTNVTKNILASAPLRVEEPHPMNCNSIITNQFLLVNLILNVAIKTTERNDEIFRVSGEVLLTRDGGPGRTVVCTDQGSDLDLISPQLVRVLRLEKHTLSSTQNQVIKIGTADRAAHRITEWVSFVFPISVISRHVHAFVRPDKGMTNDLFLLLGLP